MVPDVDIEQPAALLDYLRARGYIAAGETPQFAVLAGGVSNRTVLVRRATGEAWVLKQALLKLRTVADWYSDPARIHREADGMRALGEILPPGAVPRLLFEDMELHVIGMSAVPEPHHNFKTLLLAGTVDDDAIRQFAGILGAIHAESGRRHGEFLARFDDRSFFESLRLEPYFAYTAGEVPDAADFLHALITAVRSRRLTLVHGDFSPKNVLVHNGQLVLLDHEVIHFGDPAFDLGFAFAHLLSKAHHLPEKRGDFVRAAKLFWATYLVRIGNAPWAADLAFHAIRNTLGCLLARVAGRSPLEYLDARSRERQRRAVIALMRSPPETVEQLVEEFVARV